MMQVSIRNMQEEDIDAVALVHEHAFPRQILSQEWITCNFQAYPRILLYVATVDNVIVGYIQWIQKSGFRKNVVLELEQIAVHPDYQQKGIGRQLITETLPLVKEQLQKRNADIKILFVTTRTDNAAQKLYRETMGVKEITVIPNLYSADEVFMAKRIEE